MLFWFPLSLSLSLSKNKFSSDSNELNKKYDTTRGELNQLTFDVTDRIIFI